jgi:hypothetical protein
MAVSMCRPAALARNNCGLAWLTFVTTCRS